MIGSGITSEIGVQGLLGVLQAIMTSEAVAAGANHAVASAVTPAGDEGASMGAVGQQDMNSTMWTGMFMEGMQELQRMLLTIEADGGAVMMQDAASAATF